MVVQYILASRTVTRSKINSENKCGAQESDTKPADVPKEDDDESSTKESENDAEKESEKKDEKDETEKENENEDEEKEKEKVEVPETEEKPEQTSEKAAPEGEEKSSDEPTNDEDNENNDENSEEVEEFYVKYRNFSYLHCEWKAEEELFKGDKRIASKLKRFKQKMAHNTNIFENVSILRKILAFCLWNDFVKILLFLVKLEPLKLRKINEL